MSLGIIDSTVLADIADAIRDTFDTTKTYKPTQMANAIRTQGKPLYSFSNATDEELTEMVNAYYNGIITLDDVKSVWNVGDKRAINLSAMKEINVNESHVAQEQYFIILDFEHDDLSTSINEKTKSLITVQQLNILSNGTTHEEGPMNSTEINLGGWGSCDRRTWCNNVFKAALPNYIQNLVKQVSKKYCATYNSSTLSTSNDYIWLPSVYEATGTYDEITSNKEGYQYEYYQTVANRIKNCDWWTRSCDYGSARCYCIIRSDGIAAIDNSANDFFGIAPAFCI
jgi:hypothetical protein